MKPGIHPAYGPVVFRDKAADFAFLTRSTATSDKTIEWEDGNTYPVVDVEISSRATPSTPAPPASWTPPAASSASSAATAGASELMQDKPSCPSSSSAGSTPTPASTSCDRLLATVPGSVALHHDLATAAEEPCGASCATPRASCPRRGPARQRLRLLRAARGPGPRAGAAGRQRPDPARGRRAVGLRRARRRWPRSSSRTAATSSNSPT